MAMLRLDLSDPPPLSVYGKERLWSVVRICELKLKTLWNIPIVETAPKVDAELLSALKAAVGPASQTHGYVYFKRWVPIW